MMYPFLCRSAALAGLLLVLVGGGAGLCQTPAQPAVDPQAAKGAPVKYPDQPTVILNTTGLTDAIGTLSQATHFGNPVGQATDRQKFLLEVCTAQPQRVTWGDKFAAQYRLPLPTTTGGNNTCELWGFRFHQDVGMWYFMATTPPPAPRP